MQTKKSRSKLINNFITIGLAIILALIFGYLNLSKSIPLGWTTANGNFSNTREALGAKINSNNVANLGVSWTLPIVGVSEWGSATTNPIIAKDIVYFEDLKSNVYAVDFITGKQLWMKEYNLDIAGPAGVSLDNDKIFSVKGHYEIVALDLSGNELWTTKVSDDQNTGIDIQTTASEGMVFVSTVPGVSNENFYKGGSTGIIYALDQNTGKIVWSFDTVDSKSIWGNTKVNSGGGSWYPPAIDHDKGIMYWTVGNPAPWPGTKEFPNGTSRLGKNLYTNSLVALDLKTGKLLWYNQVLPHDLFDYDLQISPIIANIKISGAKRDVIFSAGKMGRVFAFDKSSGDKIWETSVGTHLNDTLIELPKGITKVSPGPLGGVETNMAYSDGIIYVPVVNMEVEYNPSEFIVKSFDLAQATGELVALNASDGQILWTQAYKSMNVGSATIVNDLVFTSTLDGKIYAYDKKTGKEVWQYTASGGINGWPAVKGDTIIFPVGMGKAPELVAFKVGNNSPKPSTIANPISGQGKSFKQ